MLFFVSFSTHQCIHNNVQTDILIARLNIFQIRILKQLKRNYFNCIRFLFTMYLHYYYPLLDVPFFVQFFVCFLGARHTHCPPSLLLHSKRRKTFIEIEKKLLQILTFSDLSYYIHLLRPEELLSIEKKKIRVQVFSLP